MRNDTLDELDQLPSLTLDDRPSADVRPGAPFGPAARGQSAAPRRSLAPWLLVALLLPALGGLGWWSQQQIERLEQQLVATQESFARISEDAAGRLKDITGKVVANESSVTSESEALKLRIKQLDGRMAELGKLLQASAARESEQGRQIEQLREALKTQQADGAQLLAALKSQQDGVVGLESRVKALVEEQATQKAALEALGKLDARLQGISGDVAALKKQGNPSQAISRLEADLLVLRSELDSRPASGSTAELDAFRAQVTRNITTLQAQVQNLQQQLNAR